MKYLPLSVIGLLSLAFTAAAVPPTINLRSPAAAAVFTASPTLNLVASGSDPDGFIAKVEFYQGVTKIGQVANALASVTNFVYTWTNVPAGGYSLTAVATDNGGGATTSAPVSLTIQALAANATNLVPAESVWKYLDNGSDQGTAWRALSFPDGGWASGPAQLGYGDGDEVTEIGFGPNASAKYITTYFRRAFVSSNVVSFTNLILNVLRDDGVVVYLNGNEIFRDNLAAGQNYLTTAGLAIGGTEESVTFLTANVSPTFLVNGTNILAVEMHQNLGTSSDLSFDLQLIGQTGPVGQNIPPSVTLTNPANNSSFSAPATMTLSASASDNDGSVAKVEFFSNGGKLGEVLASPYNFPWTSVPAGSYALTAVATDNLGARSTSGVVSVTVTGGNLATNVLIAAGSSWKYLDDGSDQGSSWTNLTFNDAGWSNGVAQLGYGDGDEATVVRSNRVDNTKITTTYFRKKFVVSNAAAYTNLTARLLRDDGAVIYLNGIAVWFSNMPQPPINYLTTASAVVGGAEESTWFENQFNPAALVSGTNILAVEIHQSDLTSSDISFDFELIGIGGTASNVPPTVTISTPTNNEAFGAPANITITANAADSDGSVSKVEFYSGASKIGEALTSPWTFNWNGVAIGSYALRAIATDNSSSTATSSVVNVSVVANSPPTVGITSPTNNQTFSSGQSVTINATATDNGSVSKVEFFADGFKLGEDLTSPYNFTWPNPGSGAHALVVVATDNLNSRATSSVVNISIAGNLVPIVSITSPANNSTFTAPTNVPLSATASDPDGTVAKVEYYAGTLKVAESAAGPAYNAVWTNNLIGSYTLQAVAYDLLGAMGTSAPVSVTFTGLPPATLIAAGSVWKYLDTGVDQGTAWVSNNFNDSTWQSGPAQLGYGDGDELTVVGFGPDPNNKHITTYFRQAFVVANRSAYSSLAFRLLRDDGAVVYLNGKEVFRSNLPGGPIGFSTLAALASDDGTVFYPTNAAASLLVNGTNVVAVEIHQNSITSSDISFDLELIGNTGAVSNAPPTVALISPANNSSFTEPADITLTAAASDPDSAIDKVEFFRNGNIKIGESLSAPYTILWSGVTSGAYAIRAVATDIFGATGTSSVVNVSVTSPSAPTVASVAPPAGNVTNLSSITVHFSEAVSGVDASDLLVNGTPATTVSGAGDTFTFFFSQPLDGLVAITWAANHGVQDLESTPQPFNGNAPGSTWQYVLSDTVKPLVARIDPLPGASLNALQEIKITFSEAVGGVNASDLLVNGAPALSVAGNGFGPYTFAVTQPTNGTVQLSWAVNHGIHDFASASNLLVTSSWSYTLNTNLLQDVVINEIMYHPANETTTDEWVEIFNRGSNAVNLTGWKLSKGVNFEFPATSLRAGAYLVVCANLTRFNTVYSGVTNVLGNWDGTLSNTGEEIRIEDASGNQVDSVTYADEGDWAVRRRNTQDPPGYTAVGWDWFADHDGLGKSVELVNPTLANKSGQNWSSSIIANGTPGRINSALQSDIAPMILDVIHSPAIPKSTSSVTVTARLVDEQTTGNSATLFYRTGTNLFASVPMFDDGQHGDGVAGDSIFAAVLPPNPNLTIIEFYIQAVDAGNHVRTWPGPTDGLGTQGANALYQVDDSSNDTNQPIYRLIMTADEAARLANLNSTQPQNNSPMNATFISVNGDDIQVRYMSDVRLRGAGSRGAVPPNYRVKVRSDNRWNGVTGLNLNTQYTHSQLAGSLFTRLAGMNTEQALPVQVRVNGLNMANSGLRQYGSYVHLEARDSAYAQNHFPNDPNGNLYTATRPSVDLSYLGTNPQSYINAGYLKDSNGSENDYTDLINLTYALSSNTPDSQYTAAVRQVADVDEWMRYFAVTVLIGYNETSLGTGVSDDYTMYRGVNDPRCLLFFHDHDTDFGEGDSPCPVNAPIFRATALPVVNRFLKWPDFVPIFYSELKRQAETTFAPSNFDPTIDQALNWVPNQVVANMKSFNAQRRAFVLSQIPLNLTVNSATALGSSNGLYRTTSATLGFYGEANVIDTRKVLVNGMPAYWSAWEGRWTNNSVALQPGINNVLVQALGTNNTEIASSSFAVWYDTGTATSAGPVSGNVVWTPSAGPYNVTASLTIGNGATLTIQAGTTVYIAPGATINVTGTGRLLAEGNMDAHIRLTRQPAGANWGSLDFINASLESRLAYVDFDGCGGTTIGGHNAEVHANNAKVFFDHLTFANTPTVEYISFDASSFIVQNSVFPTYPFATSGPEMLHGVNGIQAGGYGIFRSNYFGHTYGFNDTIDFTGGNRPSPILQFIGNVFDGAGDDHLDLDSTDAWIEGNIFMHAHRDTNRTDNPLDTASAISGGLDFASQYSEWTIINNLFYDVDHAVLNKEGGRFIFAGNTLVHVSKENGSGQSADIAAFNFTDDALPLPGPSIGAGSYIANNIIWDCPVLVANYNATNLTVIFENNILPTPWAGPGSNNIVADPLLNLSLITNVLAADWRTVQAAFQPKASSPAIGTGTGGFDRGGLNPKGLLVYGEPSGLTPSTTASFTLFPGGVFNWGSAVPPYLWGYTYYKWKLDNGPWSAEISITNRPTLTLSNLSNGPHTLYVSGKNDAGYYQDDPFVYPVDGPVPAHATASRTWVVNTNASAIRLNEILAANSTAVPVGAKYPDLVELYNNGSSTVDLGGMGMTDSADEPYKFVFPAGTIVAPGQFLVLYADNDAIPVGIHLGFSLRQSGENLYLFNSSGRLLDSVEFGLQLADSSIGRLADGKWALTKPTFGGVNKAVPLGNPAKVKINEWLAASLSVPDFIELYNPGSLPVSVGNFYLSDQPIGAPAEHRIAPLSFIAANGFGVFIADGRPQDGADHLSFQLSKDQGMIGLSDAALNLIDMVVYGSQKNDISQGRSPNGSSTILYLPIPTPGAPNPNPIIPGAGRLVLNEILANNVNLAESDGTIADWVELHNGTSTNINLADLSLSDTSLVPRRFVFPAGAVIPAGGFYTLRFDPNVLPSATNSGFGLKKTGGSLYLFDNLPNGGGLIDGITYGLQAVDFSIGRMPNGSTNWVLALPTRNAGNLAASLGVIAQLKVNEWMAAPASGSDWFEIYNPNPQPVALGGLFLTDDLSTPATRKKYQIPALSFVGTGLYGFQQFFADDPIGGDHTGFKLSNTGEAVGISNPDGSVIDSVTFGAQQIGVSQGRLPDGDANTVSFSGSASPADSNYLPLPDVVINEALSHTDLPLEDAIELRNLSGSAVNIGGWFLSDAKHTLKKYRIPDGTVLPANGFKVFYENQFNSAPGSVTSFSLSSAKGDEVYLSVANTNGALTGYRASAEFGAAQNGVSFGRYQTSVGIDFVAMAQRTFGTDNPDTVQQFRTGTGLPNSAPKVGPIVISEIMYHPPDVGTNDNVVDEFIEFHNITGSAVSLYDPAYPTNVWKLKKAVTFSFPANVTIPANAYFVVVSFDPGTNAAALAAFRSKYSVPGAVPVFGPYLGKLNNASDSIEIHKPDAPQQPPALDAGFVPYILVDRIKYADLPPWPTAPDGTGASLQRINDLAYGNDPVNWTSGNPTPGRTMNQDTDGDGLPDDWEIANGLDPNNAVGVNGANGDPDNDGMTNLQEYQAGTDPHSSASNLRLQIISLNPIRLRFVAQPNRSYTIEYATDLGTTWTKLLDVDPVATQTTFDILDDPGPVRRFYRIRTPKSP
jgi:hypothetical protein